MPRERILTDQNEPMTAKTASPGEIARFSAIADAWWDTEGDFKPLHRLNPTRLAFIRDHASARFGRDPIGEKPLDGLRVLDIGCGGGLLSEPMTRLGARVVGIDAAEKSIQVARVHAERGGLDIDYRCAPPEDFAQAAGGEFDIVLNMEVLEHVADLDAFFAVSASMVKRGGIMVVSTINRTFKSLALAKIGAEYVLRWLPAGTHDWRKFVRPSELADGLGPRGIQITQMSGVAYNPLRDEWGTSRDLSVNYMALGVKD